MKKNNTDYIFTEINSGKILFLHVLVKSEHTKRLHLQKVQGKLSHFEVKFSVWEAR